MIEQELKEQKQKTGVAQYGFKTREENGGVIDYRIHTKGRPTYKGLTNKEIREKEFLLLLRKLKPHISSAIGTAVKIMQNENSSEANRLKAAALILQNYKEIMKDAYDPTYDTQEAEEINQESVPVFSLKMINAEDVEDVGGKG
jgi:hypothetical protein